MDNPRLFLWIGLALLAWMNIIQWDRDYGTQSAAPATTASSATSPAQRRQHRAGVVELASLPSATAPAAAATAAATQAPAPARRCRCRGNAPTIRVVTDVIDMDISLQGGDLLRADLLQYPRDKKPGSPPVRLLSTDDARSASCAAACARPTAAPNRRTSRCTPRLPREFRLAPGAQELRVPLTWTDGQGVTVTKTYVFKPGQYAFDVVYDVQNASGADWKAASYVQFVRHVYAQKRSMFDVESYAFRGPAVYDGKKYQKLDVDDEEDAAFRQAISDGWMAEMQHHFVAAAVPPKGETYDFSLQREGSAFAGQLPRPAEERARRRQRHASTRSCSSARSCRSS